MPFVAGQVVYRGLSETQNTNMLQPDWIKVEGMGNFAGEEWMTGCVEN